MTAIPTATPAVVRAPGRAPGTLHRSKSRLTSPAATIAALIIAIIWTIPTFGLFVSSFRPASDLQTSGWWVITSYTFDNYLQTLKFTSGSGASLGQSLINSFAITIPATIIPIILAALAAYAFAWIEFRGRNVLFIAIFALQVVPLQMAIVPLLSLFANGLKVGDQTVFPALYSGTSVTFAGVWFAHTMFALPLAIFMLHNAVSAVPSTIIEAARVDGAGHGQIFFRIVLPLALPAMAAFAIFQFLWVWNDLLVATIFASGSNAPITKFITDLSGTQGSTWYLLTAGTFLAIIVPLIVFFALQRFFVRGLLAGSDKG